MRFIIEFEREVISIPDTEFISNFPHISKILGELKLWQIISDSFGWKENIVKMFDGKEMNRWSLEIEAFPMDKWIEFKKELLNAPIEDIPDHFHEKLINLFSELESFGKPAGAAIT